MATLESVLATTPDLFSSMTPNLFSVAFLAVLFMRASSTFGRESFLIELWLPGSRYGAFPFLPRS